MSFVAVRMMMAVMVVVMMSLRSMMNGIIVLPFMIFRWYQIIIPRIFFSHYANYDILLSGQKYKKKANVSIFTSDLKKCADGIHLLLKMR